MNFKQYEWHARRVFFFDRVNRQRYQAAGFELVWVTPNCTDTRPLMHSTGLGYYSQYRTQEFPPLYYHNETQLGAYGSYYPLHIPSGEQFVFSAWSCEETIRWFLQQLVERGLWSDYWLKEESPTILDRFPGGRSAIAQLEHLSVCKEIARLRGVEDGQMVRKLKGLCEVAAQDQRMDEGHRSIFFDLTCRIDTEWTLEDCLENLEKWTTNW